MDLNLTDYLEAGKILVADGATGTMLMSAGLPPGMSPELWNVEQPEKIIALHRAYLEAGSQIILSNTFGGCSIKLGKVGIADRTRELNLAAGRLACQAAGGKAFVAGDIGPSGELMQPLGSLTYADARTSFAEQAAALSEGGVDAIWVETMSDLEEARAAVEGAKEATSLPVFCSLSFTRKRRTIMGVTPRRAALELWPLGLSAIGLNCGEGLDMVPDVLSEMKDAVPEAVLIAKPNAGLPKLVQGATVYDVKPEEFSRRMSEFVELGAQVVGSCCGSSPDYIAELVKQISAV